MTDSTSSAVVYAYSLNFNMRSVLELDIYLYSSNIYISSTSNIGITVTMKIAISNGVLNAVFMHSVSLNFHYIIQITRTNYYVGSYAGLLFYTTVKGSTLYRVQFSYVSIL